MSELTYEYIAEIVMPFEHLMKQHLYCSGFVLMVFEVVYIAGAVTVVLIVDAWCSSLV